MEQPNSLRGIKAFAFDAYGTIFDVHSAVMRHATRIGPNAQAFSELWRFKQLEYSWVLTLSGQWRDFWQLTEDALDFALARFVKIQASVKADLMLSYRTLTSYPEIGETLDRLRDANYRTGILSNGETAMLNDAVSSALIADRLDHVWSVDAVRLYKPHPRVYEMATAGFGLNANEICLISSNRWDVAGATAFGMKAIWVNRTDNPPEYGGLPPIAMLGNLTELHAKLA